MQDEQMVMLAVDGMNCAGCVRAVESAIRDVPGVREASVDLGAGRAQVRGTGLSVPRLVEVVEDAGFKAREV